MGYSRNSLRTLTRNQIKFESAQKMIDHVRFVLQLVERHRRDKQSYLVLVGYVEKHKLVCPLPNCCLKMSSFKLLKSEGEDAKEWVKKLFLMLEQMFDQGVRKFKTSVKLRIAYAFFLIERMNNKKRALEELTIAEKLRPSFEDEFLIYRYKKIVDEKLDEAGERDGSREKDIVGIIAFETHLRLCVDFIKRASENQREFWTELLEEKPSLVKLAAIGNDINFATRKAKENWAKLYKLNSSLPSVLKIYSKFLTSIVNEKDTGKKLMEQFNSLVLKQQDELLNNFSDIDQIRIRYPMVVFGFQNNDLGTIKRVNKEFVVLVGWTEEELLGQKMEIYMPNIFRSLRSTLITSMLFSGVFDNNQHEVKKETFIRKKNGSIILVESTLKIFFTDPSKLDSLYIVNIIKPVENTSHKIYLLTNKNGIVHDATSNSLTTLGISFERLSFCRLNLHLILPKNTLVDYCYRNKGCEMELNFQGKHLLANCVVSPILISTNEEKEKFEGYVVLIDIFHSSVNNYDNLKKKSKSSFKLNIWELLLPLAERDANQLPEADADSSTPVQENLTADCRLSRGSRVKRNIIVKRLWKNEIEDLHEKKVFFDNADNENSNLIIEDVKKSVFKENIQLYKDQLEAKNIKGRKNLLIQLINKDQRLYQIVFYKVCSLAWVFALLLLSYHCLFKSMNNYGAIFSIFEKIKSSLLLIEGFPFLLSHYLDVERMAADKSVNPRLFDNIRMTPQLNLTLLSMNSTAALIANNSMIIENYGSEVIEYIVATVTEDVTNFRKNFDLVNFHKSYIKNSPRAAQNTSDFSKSDGGAVLGAKLKLISTSQDPQDQLN